jgi:dTDP-6-deoxy-L-talose 4-dehydrogenase (NAD+)
MRVLVTGGTGFIGRHVVAELIARSHDVTIVGRERVKPAGLPPVNWIGGWGLGDDAVLANDPGEQFDAAIHMAWAGLPDYRNIRHVEENVAAGFRLVERLAAGGVRRILVTGTCLEYGMSEGCLAEDRPADPGIAYGIAKDALRRLLQQLQDKIDFTLIWARLFYTYGEGQNPNALYSQLMRAIRSGDESFAMSTGDQLRDFLPVGRLAERLVNLLECPQAHGIVNCCSGKPTSVLSLVQDLVAQTGAKIRLDTGRYPYPDFEPRNFWGSTAKYDALVQSDAARS